MPFPQNVYQSIRRLTRSIVPDAMPSLTTRLAVLATGILLGGTARAEYEAERADLVAELRAVSDMPGRTTAPRLGEQVLEVMARVPRHEFVPEHLRSLAYQNRPLPIGDGQTISQPYIVALMTELAGIDSASRVLEVGTGSGYQAAVLAELAGHVHSIEIIEVAGP